MQGAIATHIGKIKRENQDVARFFLKKGIAVLADGMGGHARGKEAAEKFCNEVMQRFDGQEIPPEAIISSIADAFEIANQDLYNASTENEVTGTTGVVAMEVPGGVIIAHVGDSRAYRFRNGEIAQLTIDHSRVQELLDQGILALEDVKDHPLRTHLTRSIGTSQNISIDFAFHEAVPGDLFLLATDGLAEDMPSERMAEIIGDSELTIDEKANCLVEDALEGKASDNITVVVFKTELFEPNELQQWNDLPKTISRPEKDVLDENGTTGSYQSVDSKSNHWKWYAIGLGSVVLLLLLILVNRF